MGGDLGACRGGGDVPETALHLGLRRPGAEGERGFGGEDKREGGDGATACDAGEPEAQVKFGFDRPPSRDDQAVQAGKALGEQVVEVAGDGLGSSLAGGDGEGGALGQQAQAFGFAPARDVAGLLWVDVIGVDFLRKTSGGGVGAGGLGHRDVSRATSRRASRAAVPAPMAWARQSWIWGGWLWEVEVGGIVVTL